jgi:hypothetical protein
VHKILEKHGYVAVSYKSCFMKGRQEKNLSDLQNCFSISSYWDVILVYSAGWCRSSVEEIELDNLAVKDPRGLNDRSTDGFPTTGPHNMRVVRAQGRCVKRKEK